jgi:hypothetical protein
MAYGVARRIGIDSETAGARGIGELAVVSEKDNLAGVFFPQQGRRQMDRIQRLDWHRESAPSSPEHGPVDWNQIESRQVPLGFFAQPSQFRVWCTRGKAQPVQRPQEFGYNQLG